MGWSSADTPSQIEVGNKLETKPGIIEEILNNFFIDKVLTIRRELRKVPESLIQCWDLMREKTCKMSFSHVTVATVRKLLKKLKNSKSTGVDELDSYAVKLAADFIDKPLHHIITLSIMQNKFPTN